MDHIMYIGFDLHRDTISAAVLDSDGRLALQSVLATRAAAVIDFFGGHIQGLSGAWDTHT